MRETAPAKVNLTLRVLGRRADGLHEIESLVAFAGVGDALTLTPGDALALSVGGPTAAAAGDVADNLVLKAARALAECVQALKLGRFTLSKRLPVAAGLGGGSTDAAAALRLLARANGLAPDDARLMHAARSTGADVPVCLDPRPRFMRGVGDILSDPLDLQRLFAVSIRNLYWVGTAIAAYALLEGVEAIGLWLGRRWAEYLTLVATVVFVPYEIYELTKSVTALKVVALVINLAIVAYLLFSKRLFGVRGGGRAERAEHDADIGWPAIERATPEPFPAGPSPAHAPAMPGGAAAPRAPAAPGGPAGASSTSM